MLARDPFNRPGVCEVLDIFYADRETPGQEPDWAAIKTELFKTSQPLYSLTTDLLRALWIVYEDEAYARTAMWAVKNGVR